jgi:hypothetical protein
MERHDIHLELLIGRKVIDVDGRPAGKIEEFIARRRDGKYYVEEVHLGREALFERLSIVKLSLAVLRIFGATGHGASHKVPWDKMDLIDSEHPRLKCKASELQDL